MPQVTFGQLCDTRRNNFDFLRFFLASLVIFSHSYVLLSPNGNASEPGARLTSMKMDFGSLAVACFFAISGFLITQSWHKTPRVKEYLMKRVLRIYPGWIAALLFGVFIAAPLLRPHHGLELGIGTLNYLSQLVFFHIGIAPNGWDKSLPHVSCINSSTWTLPFEVLCYLLVILLGRLNLFHKRVLILLPTLALLIYCALPAHTHFSSFGPLGPSINWMQLPYFGNLRTLPILTVYFLSGALFYLYRDRIPQSPFLLAGSLLLMGLSMFDLPLASVFFVVLPTFGFYILFYLAFLPLGSLHAFARHGDLSYGIYLYAFPLQRLLIAEQFRGYHLTPLVLFLAAWVLACGAAALSWRLVERPFLKLKPRSSSPPAESVGVPAVPAGGF